MTRVRTVLLTLAIAPALDGCVAAMAMSAASLAADAARGTPVANEQLRPQAQQACSTRAAQYGAVRIIDVQQASASKIVVWGTVGDGSQKRSFQCDFTTRITGFKLRSITPQS